MRTLRSMGYRLLGRNLRAPEAELDALAREGGDVVVVEVKSGFLSAGPAPGYLEHRPLDRLTRAAVRRRQAAARRLAGRGEGARVDVVEVALDPRAPGAGPRISVFKRIEPTAVFWPWAR